MALPQLLFFDQNGFDIQVAAITAYTVRLQAVVGMFNSLNAPIALTSADLPRFSPSQIRALVFDKFFNATPPVVSGVPLSREKLQAMMEYPAGTDELVAAVADLHTVPYANAPTPHLIDGYVLTGSVVSYSAAKLAALEEGFKTYARTQKQADFWNALQTAATALNTLADQYYTGSGCSVRDELVGKFFEYTGNMPGKVKIKHHPITQLVG